MKKDEELKNSGWMSSENEIISETQQQGSFVTKRSDQAWGVSLMDEDQTTTQLD